MLLNLDLTLVSRRPTASLSMLLPASALPSVLRMYPHDPAYTGYMAIC